MNERIRELLVEAGVYECDDFEPHPTFEKFAELIVKECMELTHWKDFDMSVEKRIRSSVYQDIKEHFGVEQ